MATRNVQFRTANLLTVKCLVLSIWKMETSVPPPTSKLRGRRTHSLLQWCEWNISSLEEKVCVASQTNENLLLKEQSNGTVSSYE
jgi:hypothetical protein